MSNVINFDSERPHSTTSMSCHKCGHEWVAVYITGTKALECPDCHSMVNEFGVEVLIKRCADCGSEYTVVPKPGNTENWQSCLSVDCPSYDPDRDMDYLFEGGNSRVVHKAGLNKLPDWVQKLKVLAESATPGPWHGGHGACIDKVALDYRDDHGNMTPDNFTKSGGHAKIVCKLAQTSWRDSVVEDARFIAAANPNAVLLLINLLATQQPQQGE